MTRQWRVRKNTTMPKCGHCKTSQDVDRWGGCIHCRRNRQRIYQAECREARRRLRAVAAALAV